MQELLARVSTHLLIPCLFALWLARSSATSRVEWAIDALLFWSYVVLVFLAGSWAFLGYGVRYLGPVLLLAGTVRGARRLASRPVRPRGRLRPAVLGTLALVLLFAALQAVVAQSPGKPTLALVFPLRDGTYYVLEGGRHPWVNRFAGVDSLRCAVEFARLGSRGRIDRGTDPSVWSPLSGRVISVSGGVVAIAGAEAGARADAEATGDSSAVTSSRAGARAEAGATGDSSAVVTSSRTEVVVKLWPVRMVEVQVGAWVDSETRLGQLEPGESGVRSLSVAAQRGGDPAPIRFGGHYLARNALFRARQTPVRSTSEEL